MYEYMWVSTYVSDSGNSNDSKSKSYELCFHEQQGNVATLSGLVAQSTAQITDALTNGQSACSLLMVFRISLCCTFLMLEKLGLLALLLLLLLTAIRLHFLRFFAFCCQAAAQCVCCALMLQRNCLFLYIHIYIYVCKQFPSIRFCFVCAFWVLEKFFSIYLPCTLHYVPIMHTHSHASLILHTSTTTYLHKYKYALTATCIQFVGK